MYLSNQFLSQYQDKQPPFGGNGLGHFVYLRTYSRWLPEKQRRETWLETCARVVEYSLALYQGPAPKDVLTKEAETFFDALFNLRVFPAGRTLWVGGTLAADIYGTANFNCTFRVVDNFEAFCEGFYLLMVGAGFGFRVLPEDVNKLPSVNKNIVLANKPYHGKTKLERIQNSMKFEEDGNVYIVVGDSKEGWIEALREYFNAIIRTDVDAILINYDSVRPRGEPLKTFGGRASGHEALRDMFKHIHKIIRAASGKLRPIDCMDIMNIIGYYVVVGGVRRTSEICLFAPEDLEILNAKLDLYREGSINYGKFWRAMSNNTIFFEHKPEKEFLAGILTSIKYNGEPGFLNAEAARKRRPNFQGINPLMA